MNDKNRSTFSQTVSHFIDDLGAESCASQIDMCKNLTMLDQLSKHEIDIIDMLLILWIVSFPWLHDIVPGEIQVIQSSILLQDL